MVHPSELLRTDSNEGRVFSAPRVAMDEHQLDCGITSLPFINRCCNLERFAKPKVFLVFLSLLGFLQGVTLTYFRETAKFWGEHYNIAQDNIDWLIYTNEFFVGIFALVVSYYGNRIHRISWIAGLTLFQTVASGILIVPEVFRKNFKDPTNITDSNICVINNSKSLLLDTEINYIALTVLGVYQIFFAMVSISFITHGITYLDDNTSRSSSPGYIGIALACRELGKQAGLYSSWIPSIFKMTGIFVSPVWYTIIVATFVSGVLISMFPRSMPSVLVRTFSASIMDLASGHQVIRKEVVDAFFKTLWRLLKNPILMINIFSAVLLESGLINFGIFEKYFNQSRFQVSKKLTDTSYTQFTTNILKQPLVAISLIAAGFLAAKTRPHLKSLVKWNIAATILIIIFFGSTAFLTCQPKTSNIQMLDKPACSRNCYCNWTEFQPVCLDSETYYSPCFAACTSHTQYNSKNIYSNCTCGRSKSNADEGPCNQEKCDLYYAVSQVNRVITTALLETTVITNLIINMRCILSRDKATALGLEATFTGLIPYLPVKAIYGVVAEQYCIFYDKDKNVCRLYSIDLAMFLSLATVGLMTLSLVLSIVVLILLKLKPIREKDDDDDDNVEDDDDDDPVELHEISRSPTEQRPLMMNVEDRDEVDLGQNRQKLRAANSNETIPDSLLELEDVGDDHDSIDSSSYLDDSHDRLNRGRIVESDL